MYFCHTFSPIYSQIDVQSDSIYQIFICLFFIFNQLKPTSFAQLVPKQTKQKKTSIK